MNLNDFMKQQPAPQQNSTTAPESDPVPFDEVIIEGRRNTTLSEYAGNLNVRFGDTEQARKLFMEKANSCSPPLPDYEIEAIWKSAVGFGKRVSAQEGYIPPEEYNNPTPRKPGDYSDLGQAYIFAKFCRDYVRYSPATDYIVYDGICWQESKPRAQAALDEFTDE
nr:MAG TPA: dsDNA helicase [Caudoviricetes sp.]